jgi:hypothetical protein
VGKTPFSLRKPSDFRGGSILSVPPAVCTYEYRYDRPCHKRGERCTHPTEPGSPYCRWHQVLPDKDFRGIDFSDAAEEHKHLCEAHLVDARLDEAVLFEVLFHDANLHGVSLTKANLQGANLSQANLLEADFWGANLKGAILWGANLQGAQLILTQLQFADLVRANLENAMFDGATCEYTDFRGADLQLAHFEGANISSCYFAGEFGSARLMLCTLKNAESLEHLVAQKGRFGLRSDLSSGDKLRAYTIDDYVVQHRDHRDIARDHRVLKIYFKQEGRLDRSSKHYLEEMRTMRKYCWKQAAGKMNEKNAAKKPSGSERVRWAFRGVSSKLLDTLFGYGEEPKKLIAWTLITVLLTAVILFWFDLTHGIPMPTLFGGFLTSLATTLVSFAVAPPIPVWQVPQFWLASVTAFVGKFFLALFVFILGRKVER